MFLLFGGMFGLSMAATILVAQYIGAKNIAEAKRVVGTSAAFFSAVSVGAGDRRLRCRRAAAAWLQHAARRAAAGARVHAHHLPRAAFM